MIFPLETCVVRTPDNNYVGLNERRLPRMALAIEQVQFFTSSEEALAFMRKHKLLGHGYEVVVINGFMYGEE